MPRVARSKEIAATANEVWRMVADPHHLPRWWPRTIRVEDVSESKGVKRSRFTQVLETDRGNPVRADFRCTAATEGERLVFEQQIEGTPFDRFLRASALEIRIRPGDSTTRVELVSEQRLRGLSRLGGPMMRAATRRTLNAALAGLDEAFGSGEEKG